MSHRIDCGIIYLCSHWSSPCCIVLIVTVFICVLMVLPHVALDLLWHCLSVVLWFFLMLHWIDSDIVCLCSCVFSSCCIGFIVKLFVFVLMVLPHDVLDWLWYCFSVFLWFFLMLHWIYCDIVCLCSCGSSSCCIGFIVTLFVFVLMVLPHDVLDWLWYCFSVVLWFFLMLHWIDSDIVCLCSCGSSSCCIGFIVTLFIFVFMGLSYVALDWLWHCLSVFSWFFLMLPWIHCYIVRLCSYGSSSCCIGLIVILFFLCSYGSTSCCIQLILGLFICVLMVLPHVALDWLWHC